MQIIRWLEEGQETEDSPGLSDKTTEMSWTKKDWTEMGRWPISAESNLFSLHSLGSSLLRPTSIYQRWGQHPEDAGQRSCHPCPGGSDELLTFLSSIILEICFLHAQDQLSSGECLGSRTFAQMVETKVTYLGVQITHGSRRLSSDWVQEILQLPSPTTWKQLQAFMWLTGYCRIWTPNNDLIAQPLYESLKRWDDSIPLM